MTRRKLAVAVPTATVLAALLLFVGAEVVYRLARPGAGAFAEGYWNTLEDQWAPCAAAKRAGPKRAGVTRIAVVGESSAQFLGDRLAMLAAKPGASFEVLSCGLSATSLEQAAVRFEQVRATKPDVVVVVVGHNLDHVYPSDVARIRLHALLSHSHLLTALGLVLTPSPGGLPPRDGRVRALDETLRRFAKEAQEDGTRLVLNTLTPNFWLPVDVPENTSDERGPHAAELFDARFLHATGRLDEAIAKLAPLAKTTHDASVPYELGGWLEEKRDFAGARAALEQSLELGANRVTAAMDDTIRQVAADTHVLLRDTLADREKATTDGIPGWESLADNCHLQKQLILREAKETLRLLGLTPPDDDEPTPRISVVLYHLDAIRMPREAFQGSVSQGYILRSLTSAIARLVHEDATFVRELDELASSTTIASLDDGTRALVLTAFAEGTWQAGAHDAARAFASLAAHTHPAARTSFVEGLFALADHRDDDARKAFDAALALAPNDVEATAFRARLP